MTIRRAAAITAVLGAALLVTGVVLSVGVPGGLIAGGLLLVAAGASNV